MIDIVDDCLVNTKSSLSEEKLEKRKQQLREAQHRFYLKNKQKIKDIYQKNHPKEETPPKSYNLEYKREYQRAYYDKNNKKPPKETLKSYDPQYIRDYQKAYYQKNKTITMALKSSQEPPISHDPQAMREYQKVYHQKRKLQNKPHVPEIPVE